MPLICGSFRIPFPSIHRSFLRPRHLVGRRKLRISNVIDNQTHRMAGADYVSACGIAAPAEAGTTEVGRGILWG